MHIIIPAGGSGTRLWPLSRSEFPKQLLNLSGRATMIQETISRIATHVPPDKIFVLTEQSHAADLQAQVPAIPECHFIIEPTRRDTAPVIGLGAMHVFKQDPKAVVASLHADHMIAKPDVFLKILMAAEEIARQEDVIVTLGIHPTHPATCYGYIASGKEAAAVGPIRSFRVKGFSEKPDLPTAQAFLATGDYFWNAGMFIARAEVLLDAYRQHTPELAKGLERIAKAIGTPEETAVLNEVYPALPKEPIDTAIMEQVDNIVVIPADIGWSDIGSWKMLKDELPASDAEGNLTQGQTLLLDTEDSLVFAHGERMIATVGLEKMVVIDAGDAILVCPLDRAQDVKNIVNQLKQDSALKRFT